MSTPSHSEGKQPCHLESLVARLEVAGEHGRCRRLHIGELDVWTGANRHWLSIERRLVSRHPHPALLGDALVDHAQHGNAVDGKRDERAEKGLPDDERLGPIDGVEHPHAASAVSAPLLQPFLLPASPLRVEQSTRRGTREGRPCSESSKSLSTSQPAIREVRVEGTPSPGAHHKSEGNRPFAFCHLPPRAPNRCSMVGHRNDHKPLPWRSPPSTLWCNSCARA